MSIEDLRLSSLLPRCVYMMILYTVKGELSHLRTDCSDMIEDIKRTNERIQQMRDDIEELESKKALKLEILNSKKNVLTQRKQLISEIDEDIQSVAKKCHRFTRREFGGEAVLKRQYEVCMMNCESMASSWDTEDFIAWLRVIENSMFEDTQRYHALFEAISRMQITGTTIHKIHNESCLVICGLDEAERNVLLKNTARILKRDIETRDVCTGCAFNKVNVCFVPCGHQSICHDCLQKHRDDIHACPICKEPIIQSIKTYMNGF